MKIVLSDANIFIDLYKVGLLDILIQMPFEVATTDFVYNELYVEQQEALERLQIEILSFEDVAELYDAFGQIEVRSLSIQDFSLFFVAKKNAFALMSNDKKLREYARTHGVKVVGLLYVFDEIFRSKLLDDATLREKLLKLMALNKRLEKLIRNWLRDKFGESIF